MAANMKLYRIYSGFLDVMQPVLAMIEISLRPGLPTFDIIGLCDASIKECRGRVRSAIISSGFNMPQGHITVSISPSYIKKSGTGFDLPIALGLLFVSGQVRDPGGSIYCEGELSLKGDLRGTPGSALRFFGVANRDLDYYLFPTDEMQSAGCAMLLGQACDSLSEAASVFNENRYTPEAYDPGMLHEIRGSVPDISVLKGQEKAARALLIASAGRHNTILLGSPGCGKTLAGKLTAGLMPDMTGTEISEVYAINEATAEGGTLKRPFRYVGPDITPGRLMGTVRPVFPGECALANNGILFVDEICEFKNGILDFLRIPLEEHQINIMKDDRRITLPASFLFIGAGNPCRCGNLFEYNRKCTCTPGMISRYQSRLSGPFADRIDIYCEMRSLTAEEMKLTGGSENEGLTEALREQVSLAWDRQFMRYGYLKFNGTEQTVNRDILRVPGKVFEYASKVSSVSGFSARGQDRLLRVGRTIADLAGREDISEEDINEAFIYRKNMIIRED